MTQRISCYDCRYFSPGELGCPSYEHDNELGEFEEGKAGICRRHTPRHGETIKKTNGDEFVCFAEWPKVMDCDWCGEFERRHTDGHTKECDCANRAKGSENRE